MVRIVTLVALLAACCSAQVKLTQGSDRILIEVDGKPFTDFYIGSGFTKPYLHPLRSASGKIVTRQFPMEIVEGEPRDHPHQRSLWFAHGNVNGVDFWQNEASYTMPNRGTIVVKRVLDLKSGKKSGTAVVTFDWLDPKGAVLLTEARTITFYSNPTLRIIDFDIALTAVPRVAFADEKDGLFALRVTPQLQEQDHGGVITNSEGIHSEKNVWGKKTDWADYSGEVDGEKLGIAILDFPANPGHPPRLHARAYGVFGLNPFGSKSFGETAEGGLTIQPGDSLRFRYRVIIHPGDAQTANIADAYKRYAAGK